MAIFTVPVLKNDWNVSEISLSHHEKSDGHCEKFDHAVKKITITMKIFNAMKKGCNV